MKNSLERVRIDKWLWAARLYKTRQLAVKALKSSQVQLQGRAVKPATTIEVGNLITIKKGPYLMEIEVSRLSEQRGPAKVAQTLYQETKASRQAHKRLQEQLANQPKIQMDGRKPDKRGIRSNRAIKRGE